ncbi:hypothetical protein ILUMI_14938 [Ignelater luminosus]|uniref:Uncharacterized protein n=1 Tax=Ignelater luminosus TaxID=2038154 RepID=A0A8K0CXM0_IGNLU|nr:hypothetical protein ILUMI_14938 [Ignelater luminosus]
MLAQLKLLLLILCYINFNNSKRIANFFYSRGHCPVAVPNEDYSKVCKCPSNYIVYCKFTQPSCHPCPMIKKDVCKVQRRPRTQQMWIFFEEPVQEVVDQICDLFK